MSFCKGLYDLLKVGSKSLKPTKNEKFAKEKKAQRSEKLTRPRKKSRV